MIPSEAPDKFHRHPLPIEIAFLIQKIYLEQALACSERRPSPDISHGFVVLHAIGGPSRIHAVRGDDPLRRNAEVRRRPSEYLPLLSAGDDLSREGIASAQQGGSLIHFPRLNQLSDPGRADDSSIQCDWSEGADLKAVDPTEPVEVANPPGPSFAERKVLADEDLSHSQLLMKDRIGKLLRSHPGERGSELKKDDLIDSGFFEAGQLLFRACEKPQVDARGKNLDRMRIERQDERGAACPSGRCHDGLQQRAMSEVVAVEITDRRDGMGPSSRVGQAPRHGQHGSQRSNRDASFAK